MSEVIASSPETLQVRVELIPDELEQIRSRVEEQTKFTEALRQLISAGEKIIEIEDLYGITGQLKGWKQDAQEGKIIDVSEYPEVISSGLHINFDSTHPLLTNLNEKVYNSHVEAYELGGSRVIIAGDGEVDSDSGDVKNSFAAIVDITSHTQEAVVHVVSHPWGGEEGREDVVDENEYLLRRKLIEELNTDPS
jgi:hypothetical protein